MKKIIFIIPLILLLSIVGANAYVTNNVNLPVYESWLQKMFSPFSGSWEVSQPPCDATKMGCLQDTTTKECYCPIYGSNTQAAYSVMAAYPIDLYSCKVAITTNHYTNEKSIVETQASQEGGTSCSWSQSTDMPEIWAYCCAGKSGTTQNLDCNYPIQNPDGTLNSNVAISNGQSKCIGGTKIICNAGKTFVDYLDNSCSSSSEDYCSSLYSQSTYPGACQVCTQDLIQTCSDGTTITTYNCHTFSNGMRKLVPTSLYKGTCSNQYCTKNTYCADGTTILKLCVNGQLQDTGKTCPLPPSGFPKTLSKGGISIQVNSVAQETLINDYLGISPVGDDQNTYLSRLSQAELIKWRDYYVAEFNKVGLSTSQILSQYNKYYNVAPPPSTTCSDYTSEATCPSTCSWNDGGLFGIGAKCEIKTIVPCVATNQVCSDGTTIAIQTCVNGQPQNTGNTCPSAPSKEDSNIKCCLWENKQLQPIQAKNINDAFYLGFIKSICDYTPAAYTLWGSTLVCNNAIDKEVVTVGVTYSYAASCPAPLLSSRNISECIATIGEFSYVGQTKIVTITQEKNNTNTTVDATVTEKPTQISLTQNEWDTSTPKLILASSCDYPWQCAPRENYTVTCYGSDPIVTKSNEAAYAKSKDPTDLCTPITVADISLGGGWKVVQSFVGGVFGFSGSYACLRDKAMEGTCRATPLVVPGTYCDYLVWAPEDFPTKKGSCTNGVYIILGVIALLVIVPPLLGGKR